MCYLKLTICLASLSQPSAAPSWSKRSPECCRQGELDPRSSPLGLSPSGVLLSLVCTWRKTDNWKHGANREVKELENLCEKGQLKEPEIFDPKRSFRGNGAVVTKEWEDSYASHLDWCLSLKGTTGPAHSHRRAAWATSSPRTPDQRASEGGNSAQALLAKLYGLG